MIVRVGYELIVVVPDSELKSFVTALVARGQERGCLRPFDWRIETDAMRDTMCGKPDAVLEPYRSARHAVMVWDHVGSGREAIEPSASEDRVVELVQSRGWTPSNVLAVAIAPEFEGTLAPVWDRVKQLLSSKRGRLPPSDIEVAAAAYRRDERLAWPEGFRDGDPVAFAAGMAKFPKEVFQGVVDVLDLRAQPSLFGHLGQQLSLPKLKQHSVWSRLAERLIAWFPGPNAPDQEPA